MDLQWIFMVVRLRYRWTSRSLPSDVILGIPGEILPRICCAVLLFGEEFGASRRLPCHRSSDQLVAVVSTVREGMINRLNSLDLQHSPAQVRRDLLDMALPQTPMILHRGG